MSDKIEITYKNGFKQIKNVILQTEFKYVIKPRLALSYKLECIGTKPALRTYKSLKESVKKKKLKKVVLYGVYSSMGYEFCETETTHDTHKITFNVDENNKPIIDSVKLSEV